jgi:ribose 5-phosphate isomerase B
LKVSIGCDHGGFDLKLVIAEWLRNSNYFVIDLGNRVYNIDNNYPDFPERVSGNVVSGNS